MKKIVLTAFFLLATVFSFAQNADKQLVKSKDGVKVEIATSEGNIVVLLYNDTPKHRDNFLKLVKEGTYEGTLFHRVIDRFMIQGGDPESKGARPGQMLGNGTLGYTIPAEFMPHHFHKRGALCAARQGDQVNPRKESSSCQFYIVQGEVWDAQRIEMVSQRTGKRFSAEQREAYATIGGTPFLDGDYTVFGEVLKGMEVVDRIAAVDRDGFDRPKKDVKILRMKVVK